MMSEALLEDRIKTVLEALALEVKAEADNRITVRIDTSKLRQAAIRLKQMGFDHAKSVTGVDYPTEKRIELTYHVSSYGDPDLAKVILALKISLETQSPKLHSIVDVWPSAEYHERETFDLVGVVFEDHPQLQRLLLADDWKDQPPLLKSFKLRSEGIEV